MRKIILTAVLAVLAVAGWAEAQSPKVVKVTAERTGLRDRPETSATVLVTVTKGDELEVLETAGNWYRVRARASSREGYVHSLFVETVTGGAASTSSTPAPATTTSTPPPAATSTAPRPAASQGESAFANTPVPDGQRTFGAGLTTGGLAFGFTPSVRYWMNEQTGFEVNFSFLDSAGYSVTAISPSVLVRIGEAKRAGTVAFQPYAGGGITLWRLSTDFQNYCNIAGVDCDSTSLGFGGFGGTEILFDAVPKLAASASLGFFSSPDSLGYGGLYLSIAGHWYFK